MFNPMLQQNRVYLFSNGTVKMSIPKFSSLKNDFCISFDKNSSIKECNDDGSIVSKGFSFVNIASIEGFSG
jgi:hypothetical protein